MPKKILILHGWEGSPHIYWFPKAKDFLGKSGFEVFTPEMPGGYFPKKEKWLEIITEYKPDKNWVLIGHSLGGVAILKYLEIAPKKIASAVLIATPFEPMSFNPIANFFNDGFNWQKIKENCGNFVVLNELDDAVVPLEHGQKLAAALGVKLTTVPGGSHFHSLDLDFLKELII